MSTLLIAGASGLIGSETVRQACTDERIERVVSVVRHRIALEHPKLEQWIAGDDDLLSALREEHVDAVICCLGTTIRTVGGDQRRFIHVDKDLVVSLGQWAKRNATDSFCVISSMGADVQSRFFYTRVKGEMEHALKALGLSHLHIFRPSILMGPRQERRAGERMGIAVMRILSPLFIGPLAASKPMSSTVLARAMINAAHSPGAAAVATHTYRSIISLAEN